MTIEVFAPAKINLALHVTGQRADGYHLLDSLVAFAPVGDTLRLSSASHMGLTVSGAEGGAVPAGPDNLVLKAAQRMPDAPPVHITLEKRLPTASGIGGGSSDAAAVLRGLCHLTGAPMPDHLETLGADVPMCLDPHPARATGIGETISRVDLPPLPAILVNPRVAVSTPQVFRALNRRDLAPLPDLPSFPDAKSCIDWLRAQRNDLQAAAISLAPEIGQTITAIAALEGCRLARMSGSGATCFGLFETMHAAQIAADRLALSHPEWWIACGAIGDQTQRSAPRRI